MNKINTAVKELIINNPVGFIISAASIAAGSKFFALVFGRLLTNFLPLIVSFLPGANAQAIHHLGKSIEHLEKVTSSKIEHLEKVTSTRMEHLEKVTSSNIEQLESKVQQLEKETRLQLAEAAFERRQLRQELEESLRLAAAERQEILDELRKGRNN